MFGEAHILARNVASTFSDCEPVYERYFLAIKDNFVKDVFSTVANFPTERSLDSSTIIQVLSGVAYELQPNFSKPEISYGNHELLPERLRICGKSGLNGESLLAFTYTGPTIGDWA